MMGDEYCPFILNSPIFAESSNLHFKDIQLCDFCVKPVTFILHFWFCPPAAYLNRVSGLSEGETLFAFIAISFLGLSIKMKGKA